MHIGAPNLRSAEAGRSGSPLRLRPDLLFLLADLGRSEPPLVVCCSSGMRPVHRNTDCPIGSPEPRVDEDAVLAGGSPFHSGSSGCLRSLRIEARARGTNELVLRGSAVAQARRPRGYLLHRGGSCVPSSGRGGGWPALYSACYHSPVLGHARKRVGWEGKAKPGYRLQESRRLARVGHLSLEAWDSVLERGEPAETLRIGAKHPGLELVSDRVRKIIGRTESAICGGPKGVRSGRRVRGSCRPRMGGGVCHSAEPSARESQPGGSPPQPG